MAECVNYSTGAAIVESVKILAVTFLIAVCLSMIFLGICAYTSNPQPPNNKNNNSNTIEETKLKELEPVEEEHIDWLIEESKRKEEEHLRYMCEHDRVHTIENIRINREIEPRIKPVAAECEVLAREIRKQEKKGHIKECTKLRKTLSQGIWEHPEGHIARNDKCKETISDNESVLNMMRSDNKLLVKRSHELEDRKMEDLPEAIQGDIQQVFKDLARLECVPIGGDFIKKRENTHLTIER